jgi:succinate-semialdehyde dehydrogenase/glutarate-semialdehyde dehydrogenase
MTIASIDPATGRTLQTFEELSPAALEARLAAAAAAFARTRRAPVESRAAGLRRAAELFEAEKAALARTATEEMGKTLRSAVAEVEKCAWACRHYAEHGAGYLADEPLPGDAARSYLRHLPLGVVFAIMPWNFPYWQVVRFLAPALMAGNVGLLKHASNVSRCGIALEDLFRRAGFAPGVFQNLLLSNARAAEVVADPRVAAVTLTGSEQAGAAVGAVAGRSLKKVVLELGGSDPFVVMPSADVRRAAEVAVTARTLNNGQSCIAAKRFIVHERVYAEFEAQLVDRLGRLKVGDPMDDSTDLGPLATAKGRDELDAQVRRSVEAGARLLLGGRPLAGPGNYYPATALADIPKDAPAYREEVFGPVALLFKVRDLDEAIALANDSDYGLGSSVWTADPAEIARFVDELEAGQTFVNAMVASDPRLPFGGVKRSGYGRELGALGLREFTNVKTVSVGRPAAGALPASE